MKPQYRLKHLAMPGGGLHFDQAIGLTLETPSADHRPLRDVLKERETSALRHYSSL